MVRGSRQGGRHTERHENSFFCLLFAWGRWHACLKHGFVTLGKSLASGPPLQVCKWRMTETAVRAKRTPGIPPRIQHRTCSMLKYNGCSLNSCFLPVCNWSKSGGLVSFWGPHHPCNEPFSLSHSEKTVSAQTQRHQARRGKKAPFPEKGVPRILHTALLPSAKSHNQPHSLS